MEYQKITNSLGNMPDKVTRFITKKWIKVYDQSGGTCNTNKQIIFKTSMLRSDSCDCNDAYIVAKGTINLRARRGANNIRGRKNSPLEFKNNTQLFLAFQK